MFFFNIPHGRVANKYVLPATKCFRVEWKYGFSCMPLLGETGAGWDKFWLGQCPSVANESPDCETNYVFREHVNTAFTGACYTRIIDARFASEISPKKNFLTTKVDSCLRVSIWAGKLVTSRITVRACTRMMQYVWRNVM